MTWTKHALGFWLIALLSLGAGTAEARVISHFPIARFHPSPAPIIAPAFHMAGGINPAAIPTTGSNTAIGAAYRAGINAASDLATLSIASSKRRFAWGATYLADFTGAEHGGFVAAGAKFKAFSVGLGVRDTTLNSGFNPNVDVGFVFSPKGFDIGLVGYDLDSSPRVAFGVGTNSGSRLNLEANVLLPSMNNLDGNYTISIFAQMRVKKILMLFFGSSYQTLFSNFIHILGVGVDVAKSLAFTIQYTNEETATAGVTISF
jgi:hypothetical protein